jgi:hypothetical protein
MDSTCASAVRIDSGFQGFMSTDSDFNPHQLG